MGFRVFQVINDNEILATQRIGIDGEEIRMFHISGIDTSNLAEGGTTQLKLWPNGVYRYTTVQGASSQIQSYTASRKVAKDSPAQ